mgnify:CR=1 FL=1
MKIAFIGLGIMGKPMAKNLLKAGHALRVYDRSAAALQEVEAAGATACQSAAQAVEDVELVITMLPNSPEVKQVVLGSNGILEGLNSLVQSAKSRARGYRSTRNLIAMIYLIGGRLKFALPT